MHAIILHDNGTKISDVTEGFICQNFTIECVAVQGHRLIFKSKFFDTDVLICAIDSSKSVVLIKELLKQFPIKRTRIVLVVIDAVYSEKVAAEFNELGIDLYFSRPLHFRDAALDIKNVILKKQASSATRWLRAFDVWLDLEHRFARRRDHAIKLRNKEFALLEFFIMNRGKLLTRSSIFEHVWDRNASLSSNTIDVHVNRLRRKIDDPFGDKLIHTIHCIGYIFDKKSTLPQHTVH